MNIIFLNKKHEMFISIFFFFQWQGQTRKFYFERKNKKNISRNTNKNDTMFMMYYKIKFVIELFDIFNPLYFYDAYMHFNIMKVVITMHWKVLMNKAQNVGHISSSYDFRWHLGITWILLLNASYIDIHQVLSRDQRRLFICFSIIV